ncbi:MAG: SufE family protein [Flavobacteriales bacterium]|nr:SufE family protein [Flavobacteriales bacterium]
MNSELKKRSEEIQDEFAMFDDWMQKYEYIIELGKELPLIDESSKKDENLIKGCQSRVWLDASTNEDNTVTFKADSDAIITKGLVALMIRYLSDLPGEVIAQADMDFVKEIGLHEHLSPTRSNGLLSMIKQMKMYGLVMSGKG